MTLYTDKRVNSSRRHNNSKHMQLHILAFFTQIFLIVAFTTTKLILFDISFEATLISTLIIMTWWGNQTEWLNAGHYLLFCILISSLPPLLYPKLQSLIKLFNKLQSSKIWHQYAIFNNECSISRDW
jgi:NADH:ubiquinone oxidoreductase subunit 4 (subunit M)